jgi:MFS family permease
LTVEYSTYIVPCLVGRSVQGIGAGGLIVLMYAAYGDLEQSSSGSKYLVAMTCSAAMGTIGGPFVGVLLGDNWVWLPVIWILQ